jgi:hypothetical protein
MASEPKTSTDDTAQDDPVAVARAEADLAAMQAAQDQHPPARPKVAPPAEGAPRATAATEPTEQAPARGRPPVNEADVLAARVEGMAVTMRDMARVALAAVVFALAALLVSLYVLRAVRGAQAAS